MPLIPKAQVAPIQRSRQVPKIRSHKTVQPRGHRPRPSIHANQAMSIPVIPAMSVHLTSETKLCIYTCTYGDYDTIKPCIKQNIPNVDYLCFTDNPKLTSNTWSVHVFEPRKLPIIQNTFPEYNTPIHANIINTVLMRTDLRLIPALSKYDICVYIDGNVEIVNRELISTLIMKAHANDLLIFAKHPARQNAYQEASFCQRPDIAYVQKYKNTDLRKQTTKYHSEKFPETYPLFSNGFIIYLDPQSPRMDGFYDLYTREMIQYCKNKNLRFHPQGQVSLPYVLWKLAIPVHIVPPIMYDKSAVILRSHKYKKQQIAKK